MTGSQELRHEGHGQKPEVPQLLAAVSVHAENLQRFFLRLAPAGRSFGGGFWKRAMKQVAHSALS